MSEHKPIDPGTLRQGQLMSLIEHALANGRRAHAVGTYERDAYEASLGMMLAARGPWYRRLFGRWWKRRHERRMRRADRRDRKGAPIDE